MSPVPGFRYLFPSSRADAVIIYLPTDGFLGALGRKREMLVTRNNYAQCLTQLKLGVPAWFLQGGIAQQIEKELDAWFLRVQPKDLSL